MFLQTSVLRLTDCTQLAGTAAPNLLYRVAVSKQLARDSIVEEEQGSLNRVRYLVKYKVFITLWYNASLLKVILPQQLVQVPDQKLRYRYNESSWKTAPNVQVVWIFYFQHLSCLDFLFSVQLQHTDCLHLHLRISHLSARKPLTETH